LSVDGVEQNELLPDQLFRMFEKAAPEHLETSEQAGHLTYRGRHRGYTRLPQPVVHERRFVLSRIERLLTVADVLSGDGTHRIHWHFHFAPGVELSSAPDGSVRARAGSVALTMTMPAALQPTIREAWYSPSYGVRFPCRCLEFDVETQIHGRIEFLWRFTSSLERVA
jgi:hypothetical protein